MKCSNGTAPVAPRVAAPIASTIASTIAARVAAAMAAALLASCGGAGGGQDPAAATTFAKSYGGPARDQATAAHPRPGGGYLFAGTLNNRGAGSGRINGLVGAGYEGDVWVSALDDNGEVQWQRSYGRVSSLPSNAPPSAFHDGVRYSAVRAAGADAGAWLAGRLMLREPADGAVIGSYNERGTDLAIARLDANGQVVFARAADSGAFPGLAYFFAGEQTSEALGAIDIAPTDDGGAIVATDAVATVNEGGRAVIRGALFVVKVDAAGNVQAALTQRFDDGGGVRSFMRVRAIAGGAVLAYDHGEGMRIARLDLAGATFSTRWQRERGGNEVPHDLLVADADRDGTAETVLAAGGTASSLEVHGTGIEGFVLALEAGDGTERWRRSGDSSATALALACAPISCRVVGAAKDSQGIIVREHDPASGDIRAERRLTDGRTALGLRRFEAQDRLQILASDSTSLTDQADQLTLVTLDGSLGLVGSAPISGLAQVGPRGFVPGAGDTHLALSTAAQRLYRIDALGNAAEAANLDATEPTLERAYAALPFAGGTLVAGETSWRSAGGVRAAWLLRLDGAGSIVWQKRLEGFRILDPSAEFGDAASTLATSADGGIVLGGHDDRGYQRVIKLDAGGNVLWSTRALEFGRQLRALRTLADGSTLVAGDDFHPDNAGAASTAWVARIDANGAVSWQQRYTALGAAAPTVLGIVGLTASDLRITADGGTLLAGRLKSRYVTGRATDEAALIRLDAEGRVLWSKSYPLAQSFVTPNVRLAPAADGGFVFAASVQDSVERERTGRLNVQLVKTDAASAVVWSQRYGALYEEVVHGLEATADGGFVVSAQSDSLGEYSEAWLLRVGADGRIAEGCNADRGRGGVVARELPLTRAAYALPDAADAVAPAAITPVDTAVVARESADVVVARQCVGRASDLNGPPTPARTLTLRQAGMLTGVVTSTPSGIVCGTAGGGVCAAAFAEGSLVTLRVDLASLSRFSAWGPGCETTSGGSDEVCTVRVDADRTIDVYFGGGVPPPPPPYTLAVTLDPGSTGSGRVISVPAGIDCGSACNEVYTSAGQSVTLLAEGQFARWTGCDAVSGNRCTVAMNRSRNVTASFDAAAPTRWLLKVIKQGTGAVVSTPGGIECGLVCVADFAAGAVVTLSGSSTFLGANGCDTLIGLQCTVTMDRSRTVAFGGTSPPPQRYTLNIVVDRAGGFVGSTDGALGCGAPGSGRNACSASYAAGASVDLYAAALPGANVALEAWMGDCAGFGARSNITLTMDRDLTCRAVFVAGS
jgi:outer membrane protein assembly factor BamB